MNIWVAAIPVLFLFPSIALSECSCAKIKHDRSKPHVELSLDTPPNMRFFRDRRLRGEPSLVLNQEGLTINGEKICRWSGGSFFKATEPNRLLQCPNDIPIESGFGDSGVGTAVLCIELTRLPTKIAEVLYNGEKYYFDLETIEKNKWTIEPGRKEPCETPM